MVFSSANEPIPPQVPGGSKRLALDALRARGRKAPLGIGGGEPPESALKIETEGLRRFGQVAEAVGAHPNHSASSKDAAPVAPRRGNQAVALPA